MHTIRNLTNSPYDIKLADGSKERLPARGTLEGIELDRLHLPLYRTLGYFEIFEDDEAPRKRKRSSKEETVDETATEEEETEEEADETEETPQKRRRVRRRRR